MDSEGNLNILDTIVHTTETVHSDCDMKECSKIHRHTTHGLRSIGIAYQCPSTDVNETLLENCLLLNTNRSN